MITIDDFSKIEIRIARIISAEKVPETDKLLRLVVDFGEESPRQIVSGIAQHFLPEDIVGKQVAFVGNLEPKVIKGLESQGMILAVKTEDGMALLSPTKEVPSGSKAG